MFVPGQDDDQMGCCLSTIYNYYDSILFELISSDNDQMSVDVRFWLVLRNYYNGGATTVTCGTESKRLKQCQTKNGMGKSEGGETGWQSLPLRFHRSLPNIGINR